MSPFLAAGAYLSWSLALSQSMVIQSSQASSVICSIGWIITDQALLHNSLPSTIPLASSAVSFKSHVVAYMY